MGRKRPIAQSKARFMRDKMKQLTLKKLSKLSNVSDHSDEDCIKPSHSTSQKQVPDATSNVAAPSSSAITSNVAAPSSSAITCNVAAPSSREI